jgi:HSP20 family protein
MTLVRFNHQPTLSNLIDGFLNNDFESVMTPSAYRRPAVNVIESENDFGIEIAVPGYQKEDIKITVENNRLVISAEHSEEKETNKNYTLREFGRTSFTRSFSLPKLVDSEKIAAEYKDGILFITVPKKEEEKQKLHRQILIS